MKQSHAYIDQTNQPTNQKIGKKKSNFIKDKDLEISQKWLLERRKKKRKKKNLELENS